MGAERSAMTRSKQASFKHSHGGSRCAGRAAVMLLDGLFGPRLLEGRSVDSLLAASHVEVELEGAGRNDSRDGVEMFLEPGEGLCSFELVSAAA